MAEETARLRLHVQQLNNGTFIATFLHGTNDSETSRRLDHFLSPYNPPYDDRGALYYVVAVILIYGMSIILMIGSLVRKNQKDSGITNYMKDMDKVRCLERRQQKFKTRLAMQRSAKNVLGSNKTVLTIPSASQNVPTNAEWSPSDYISMRHDSGTSMWSTDSNSGANMDDSQSPLLKTGIPEEYHNQRNDSGRSRRKETGDSCNIQMPSREDDHDECGTMTYLARDKSLPPEPPSPSLAVLQEEEEEEDEEVQLMGIIYVERNDRNILINIDDVETELVASSV
jgi:hypothetical protein